MAKMIIEVDVPDNMIADEKEMIAKKGKVAFYWNGNDTYSNTYDYTIKE